MATTQRPEISSAHSFNRATSQQLQALWIPPPTPPATTIKIFLATHEHAHKLANEEAQCPICAGEVKAERPPRTGMQKTLRSMAHTLRRRRRTVRFVETSCCGKTFHLGLAGCDGGLEAWVRSDQNSGPTYTCPQCRRVCDKYEFLRAVRSAASRLSHSTGPYICDVSYVPPPVIVVGSDDSDDGLDTPLWDGRGPLDFTLRPWRSLSDRAEMMQVERDGDLLYASFLNQYDR